MNGLIGELDSEAFDQGELMLDCPTLRFGVLLGFVNLLGRSSLLQGDIEHGRHLEILCCSGTECSADVWYDRYGVVAFE